MKELTLRECYARLGATRPGTSAQSLLHMGEDVSQLLNGLAATEAQRFVLEAGTRRVGPQRFEHMPPSTIQLEAAIADIEDQLQPISHSLQASDQLHLILGAEHPLSVLFADHELLSREEIEEQFRLLAMLAEGYPLRSSGLPDDAGFAAGLLILRELMHHLGFLSLVRIG